MALLEDLGSFFCTAVRNCKSLDGVTTCKVDGAEEGRHLKEFHMYVVDVVVGPSIPTRTQHTNISHPQRPSS